MAVDQEVRNFHIKGWWIMLTIITALILFGVIILAMS